MEETKENSGIENTLQSIDGTLKRIEEILLKKEQPLEVIACKTKLIMTDDGFRRVPIDYDRDDNSASTES